MSHDDQACLVVLDTSVGKITISLALTAAPRSAADFLKYVDLGLYNGAAFYRVVRRDNDAAEHPIEVIQGGLLDPAKALPTIEHESTSRTGLRHIDGALSLARTQPGTGGGSAFFICVGDQPHLDAGGLRNPDGQGFAVFGRVIAGMSVVRLIQQASTSPDARSESMCGQILSAPVGFTATRCDKAACKKEAVNVSAIY